MKIFCFFVFIWLWNRSVYGLDEAPIITITDGQIRGITNETIRGNVTYYAYRGIPYAKPPTGERRFEVPEVSDPWTGILDATQDKAVCTQMPSDKVVVGSEDCLHINVYTTNVTAKLPVMVFIHGGGFVIGSSEFSIYGPDYILLNGVVYVSFNYRLGIFGFLSTENLVMPGNNGIRDQILALKWVKANIASFGGDPNKITIFGESAGAASVSYLLQTEKVNGLYNNAIMESGTSLNLWARTLDAREKAFKVGSKLGIVTISSEILVRELRKKDSVSLKMAEANITTLSRISDSIFAGQVFGPVEEPEHAGAVFSGKSWEKLSKGQVQNISVIAGFNSNEFGTLKLKMDQLGPLLAIYDADVQRLAPDDLNSNVLFRTAAASVIKEYYFDVLPLAVQPDKLTYFASQDQFSRPLREYVNQLAKYNKVYYYLFSYKGTLAYPFNTYEGVGHEEELPYIFDHLDYELDNAEFAISQKVLRLWTNFAKTGDPNSPVPSLDGDDTWVPNDPNTNTNTTVNCLNMNNTFTMIANPFEADWIFYEEIYNFYGDAPYGTY